MRKNNVQVSQRGLKRDAKNKARLKRVRKLKQFNDIAQRVKAIQAYMKQKEDASA
jgi:hypothetical protein